MAIPSSENNPNIDNWNAGLFCKIISVFMHKTNYMIESRNINICDTTN